MKIAIINGPNLNLLGTREPDTYGNQTFETFYTSLKQKYTQIQFEYFQSNIEGELVSAIQRFGNTHMIIMNPAAYTHTSVAIGDAIKATHAKVIEVHISNVHAREDFRKISYVSGVCIGTICGLGLHGYDLATQYFLNTLA
jgi:3-dehydroquinate dehydratase II